MDEAPSGRSLELELWQLEEPYAELRIRSPQRVARMAASLLGEGQRTAIVVVASETAGRFVLIDGHTRAAALRRSGADTVRSLVLPMSRSDALVFQYRSESGARRTALEQGWLVRELKSERSLAAIARDLGRSKSWASRRLGLVMELPERVQEAVRQGALSSHAAMRSLLPLARANPEDAERLAEVATKHELTTRQIELLCRGLSASASEQRERLFTEPLLYLDALEQLSKAARSERPALVKNFEVLAALARKSERLLRVGDDFASGAKEALSQVWPRTEHALNELALAVEERTHAGPGPSQGHSQPPGEEPRREDDRPNARHREEHGAPGAP